MLIKVTEDDINNGTRADMCKCPVALAILAQTEFNQVYVQVHTMALYHLFDRVSIKNPELVQTFIKDFDKNLPVEPFEFELEY